MPEASERIASVPVFFEGPYIGQEVIHRRDGAVATSRTGDPLVTVRLLTGDPGHEQVERVTMQAKDIPAGLPKDEYVRIRGSVSVTRRDGRVYVSRWGNSVECASLEESEARNGATLELVQAAG